jgi:hypothetical protein
MPKIMLFFQVCWWDAYLQPFLPATLTWGRILESFASVWSFDSAHQTTDTETDTGYSTRVSLTHYAFQIAVFQLLGDRYTVSIIMTTFADFFVEWNFIVHLRTGVIFCYDNCMSILPQFPRLCVPDNGGCRCETITVMWCYVCVCLLDYYSYICWMTKEHYFLIVIDAILIFWDFRCVGVMTAKK